MKFWDSFFLSPTELRKFIDLGEMKIQSHLFCSIKQIDAAFPENFAVPTV
jgi:hypothetical protein